MLSPLKQPISTPEKSKFYAEARPKIKTENTQSEYHKNNIKNLSSHKQTPFSLVGDMNIVKDKEFKSANETLDGKLKHNVKCGISKPTKHKRKSLLLKIWWVPLLCRQPSNLEIPCLVRYSNRFRNPRPRVSWTAETKFIWIYYRRKWTCICRPVSWNKTKKNSRRVNKRRSKQR